MRWISRIIIFFSFLAVSMLSAPRSFVTAHVRRQVDCPGAPPTRLAVGMRAHLTPANGGDITPLRVRSQPDSNGAVVAQLGSEDVFSIVEGPVCAQSLLWWMIRADSGVNGWAAEGTADSYFIEPLNEGKTSTPTITLTPTLGVVCPGTPPIKLSVGEKGIVRPAAKGATPNSARIRDTASKTGKVLGNLPEGVQFTVIGGPTCADSFVWWQIQADNGLKGWTAEGDTTKYYVVPMSFFWTPTPYPTRGLPVVKPLDCSPWLPPTRFTFGMHGVVISEPGVLIHTGPGINAPLAHKQTMLKTGSTFVAYPYPRCEDSHIWLRIDGGDGPDVAWYIAENDGMTYNVEPTEPYVTATPEIVHVTPTPPPSPTPGNTATATPTSIWSPTPWPTGTITVVP